MPVLPGYSQNILGLPLSLLSSHWTAIVSPFYFSTRCKLCKGYICSFHYCITWHAVGHQTLKDDRKGGITYWCWPFRLWIWQCYLEQRSYVEVATISKKDRDLSMKRKAAWFMHMKQNNFLIVRNCGQNLDAESYSMGFCFHVREIKRLTSTGLSLTTVPCTNVPS